MAIDLVKDKEATSGKWSDYDKSQCSADSRFWGPRFFLGKKTQIAELVPALALGSASHGKNRGPQRRRSALHPLCHWPVDDSLKYFSLRHSQKLHQKIS